MSTIKSKDTIQEISIVVCTKDRHELLLKTVNHLQSIVPEDKYLEIVVIEETNNPQPLEGKKLRYYTIPERARGLGFARNTGLKKASGSFVIFIDDDIHPAEDWFDNLLEPLRDEKVGAVGGAVLPDPFHLNTIGKCASFLGFPAGGLARFMKTRGQNYETDLISTGNCAFRSALARSVGGFDELIRNGEDTEFFSRISKIFKTIFVPNAIVFHHQRDSFKGVFKWFMKRGRGRFLRTCKSGTHPFLALIFPLRGSFLVKLFGFLLAALLLFSISTLASLIFVILTYLLWNTILWKREHQLHSRTLHGFDEDIIRIKNIITSKDVMFLLPLVKLAMDMGREVGKLMAFFRYMRHRVFAKPLILTFHYIGRPDGQNLSSDSKYYCSEEIFQKILEHSERDGWVIVPLVEIIKRLKEKSKSLYFEKILAVTFDDAYESIFETVEGALNHVSYPVTVFVPTGLVGDMNRWDQSKDSKPEKIMNWQQIRRLSRMGMEIGSHTCTHPHLLKIDKAPQITEVSESIKELRSNIPDYHNNEIAFSYPFGEYDSAIIKMVINAGYVGALANYRGNIRPTTDPYQIPRFTVSADSDWRGICNQSRSMWAKELMKDVRDWLFDSHR
jgi:GT2 family glycosyltransferase/peptidoglycan/xylan/chitin deacetylase (PgdA/CDA1 family)